MVYFYWREGIGLSFHLHSAYYEKRSSWEFHSPTGGVSLHARAVKNFFLLLLILIVLIVLVGGGGALFYLGKTSEITRAADAPPPSSPGN